MYREGPLLGRIFEIMFTRAEAEIYLHLPGTVEQAARAASVDVEEASDALVHGHSAGLLFKDAGELYSLVHPRNLDELILGDHRNNALGEEYMRLWGELQHDRQRRVKDKGVGGEDGGRRVLPLTGLDHVHDVVLPFDDAADIVRNARVRAVGQCSCRVALGKCDAPSSEICMAFDESAERFLERGAMREVDADECLAILERGAEAGLVHMSSGLFHENNATGVEFICNCCTCCCNLLYPYMATGRTMPIGRPFLAVVDAEECFGCEECVERCQFDAIEMVDDVAAIDVERCVGCGQCARICSAEAVRLARREGETFEPTHTHDGWVGPMTPPEPR
jgi:Fe-S-cluster-containing hydrogenase component 2